MSKFRYTFEGGTVKVMTINDIESEVVKDYVRRDTFTGTFDRNGKEIYTNDKVYRGSIEYKDQFPQEVIDMNTYTIIEDRGSFVMDTIGGLPFGSVTARFVVSAYQKEITLLEAS